MGGLLSTVVIAGPVDAAPGDGHAVGLAVDLAADVLGTTVLAADAVVGSTTAPPTLGTDSETAVDIALPGAVGVIAAGTVDEVTVARRPYYVTASSAVDDVAVRILGVPALAAAAVEASVICGPGARYADTTLDGLTLFSTPATLPRDGTPVVAGRPVPVTGLTGARLTATVTRTERLGRFDDPYAAATAVTAAFEITGDAAGGPVTVAAGTVTLATATCERPPMPTTPVPPEITTVEPAAGPQSGGHRFTVTGDNFTFGYTWVRFNGQLVTDLTVSRDGTTLQGTVPEGRPGPAVLGIYSLGGSSQAAYTYLVDGSDSYFSPVSPPDGPPTGGASVRITGVGLEAVRRVTFDGVAGTDLVVGPDVVEVRTPPHAPGPAAVVLEFPAGTRYVSDYEYAVAQVTSVEPAVAPPGGGTRILIDGEGLSATTEIRFGDVPGTRLALRWQASGIHVTVPPGAPGVVDLTLVMPGPDLVVPDGFRYAAPEPTGTPRIDSVNPGEGSAVGGTTATVSGANFVPGQTRVTICGRSIGPDSVTVGGASNVLTFPTPACDAGTTTITVSTPAGSSNAMEFRYVGEGPPVTEPPGADTPPPGADSPPGDGAGNGLPVTGRPLGPVVAAGLLAVLVGAALRLAAGWRGQRQ
ncbi:IPT/TIG domain-containing protein [Solwaraspora sp. WMMD791]|uniref:IPT/TIG domain-containing protein n=1 Tax=Solwaraspora sp. WMMD791 TaxID=3016086 RepID=UPI00249C3967|nr:IPT/TIG domain-containing protein [Solwaraspora sp. WMMD791]WFE25863.1 IPT/TIG domain-containing protein [Solwaraspora sp. WMMD791]